MLGHPMAEHKGYSGTVRSRVWSDIASRGHSEPGNQPDGDVRANSGITIGCGEKESWPVNTCLCELVRNLLRLRA